MLDWHGIHGVSHWTRVRINGLKLAQSTGANVRVVELFAFLHDSKRMSDGNDPGHGLRAAEYAQELNGRLYSLSPLEMDDLIAACVGHSRGMTNGHTATVLTCWDADRLDLGRVGVMPKSDHLCTDAGKNPATIRWAYQNSISGSPAAIHRRD